ncbi:unnamed protein product [Caenorhabditis angaria]|uniref:Tyrosine-protein phosphatase domain-containing protein n=1 Tax=Caenorhabditis angaria TaxID=860376 RepID=A0A9P1N5W2_9PELO|nr:unnamed protein product [Caenorhabditis angaria]
MEGAAVKKANGAAKPNKKARNPATKSKKNQKGGKHKNNHHKKKGNKKNSKSKNSGKGPFACCGGKKKKKKGKKSKKSKNVSRQPKPMNPPPNEELGEIVLVKNAKAKAAAGAPTTAPPAVTEPAANVPVVTQDPAKIDENKPKLPEQQEIGKQESGSGNGSGQQKKKEEKMANPKQGQENAKESLSKEKLVVSGTEKEKQEKEKEGKKEKENEKGKEKEKERDETQTAREEDKKGSLKGKSKWMALAKQINDFDAQVPMKEYDLVSGYIPPFVSKNYFVTNMEKNRFSDVVCLDHSRVQLSDDTYIHANWVEINEKKSAILTQLPLPHTACDFWQMIIDQSVKGMLLLLTESEYDELGGEFVFPKNQDFLHFEERNIRVGEYKSVEIKKGWEMKVLSVTNGIYKSFLHVHHFKLWPHNGIPQNPTTIWQIQSVFRKYHGTTVYVSLSGCGRAGTYALFENSHSSLHNEKANFEMMKCLEKVRTGRLHSCQNITQYSFVYSLIAEHVLGNGFQKLLKTCNEDSEEEIIQKTMKNLVIT